MRKSTIANTLIASVASLALAATAASAQGQGKGNGGGNGGGNAHAQDHGGGQGNGGKGNGGGNAGNAPQAHGNSGHGNSGNGNAGNGNAGKSNNAPQRQANANNGNGNGNSNGNGNGNGNGNAKQADRAPSNGNSNRGNGNGGGNERVFAGNGNNGNQGNGNGNRSTRVAIDPARTVERAGYIFRDNDRLIRSAGVIDGCPPGLAKKRNGCTPPGLDRRDSYRYDRADWWGLPGLSSGDYRYYGGNLVRVGSGGSILGYYPLLGGALSVGNVWPSWYDAQPVDPYYQSYYGLGSDYRYADNVLYRTDPSSSAITSIAALLTGDSFNVGQPMPAGYDVYNVPYGYRDQYVDGPDAQYRYSDGYVYEVDPTTQLIQTAIQLLL